MSPVCEYCGGFGIDHVWGCLITTDVAESKNTNHEGGSEVNGFTSIKGTLRHKATGKTIEGVELVYTRAGASTFDVALVPGTGSNTFHSSEWEFVADKKPLPTYAIISAPGYLPVLIVNGRVYQTTHGNGGAELAEKNEEFALNRLRYNGAVLFANQEILDKEEYL